MPRRKNMLNPLPEPYQSLFMGVYSDSAPEVIARLVRKGADLSYTTPDDGRTALFAATTGDRVSAIEALLCHGADPNQRFTFKSLVDGRIEQDRTAIFYARSVEAFEALLAAGAGIDVADAQGTTPLMRAAFSGNLRVVKAMLAAGASATRRQNKRRGRKPQTARDLATSRGAFWQKPDGFDTHAAERRYREYQEICDLLRLAEGSDAV